jgi:hypothetical protein
MIANTTITSSLIRGATHTMAQDASLLAGIVSRLVALALRRKRMMEVKTC